MKWSEDQTIYFVKEYVKQECLYNVNTVEYGDKYQRRAALVKLSDCMNIPGFGPKDAYQKIRNLKATYYQEIRKIKDRSDDDSRYIYTPKMKWFTILHDAMIAANITGPRNDSHSNANVEKVHLPDYYEMEYLAQDSDSNETSHNKSSRQIQEDNVTRDTDVRKRKTTSTDYNRLAKVQRTSVDTSVEPAEHEFDIFGKSVGAQLKKMPMDRAIEAQMYIQNYLSDVRLRTLQTT